MVEFRTWCAGAGLLCLGICSFLCWKAAGAYRTERSSFRPPRAVARMSANDFNVVGLRTETLPSRQGTRLRAVFAPTRNGATVILAHGSGGSYSDLASEIQILGQAGFGVLAFDWPGHGESEGRVEWNQGEKAALLGAMDWLSAQPGVVAEQIGALGYSMGGTIVAQVAAVDQRLRAVALVGTPHDAREQTLWEYRHWSIITQWPALLAIRISGMDIDQCVPERVVGQIAPRPLLIISGTSDDTTPLWMAQRLMNAAKEPRRLITLHGIGHGQYFAADPQTYARELVTFFSGLSPRTTPHQGSE